MKQVFFIDLDNTIYFTKPNKDVLMTGLYDLLDEQNLNIDEQDYQSAKDEMLRTPFLKVAEKYSFPTKVIQRTVEYLANREVVKNLVPSDDYHFIKSLKGRKFIVTAGFPKQQKSKVKMLGIADDFEEIHVVDISVTNKKQAFVDLIEKHKLPKEDILIVGDDAESEIKFGLELGIETFLLDPDNLHPNAKSTYTGKDLTQLHQAAGQN